MISIDKQIKGLLVMNETTTPAAPAAKPPLHRRYPTIPVPETTLNPHIRNRQNAEELLRTVSKDERGFSGLLEQLEAGGDATRTYLAILTTRFNMADRLMHLAAAIDDQPNNVGAVWNDSTSHIKQLLQALQDHHFGQIDPGQNTQPVRLEVGSNEYVGILRGLSQDLSSLTQTLGARAQEKPQGSASRVTVEYAGACIRQATMALIDFKMFKSRETIEKEGLPRLHYPSPNKPGSPALNANTTGAAHKGQGLAPDPAAAIGH